MKYLKDAFLLFLLLLFVLILLAIPVFIVFGIIHFWGVLPLIGKIFIIPVGVYLIILEIVFTANLDEIFDKLGLEF